jgi:hypothetical protein
MSGLHTLPARSPVNASRLPLPRATHDSGPVWLAKPSLSGTCTLHHIAGLSRRTLYGRNVSYPAPPVQSRTCSFPASGSSVVLASAVQSRAVRQIPSDVKPP